jgi:putative DNA primase/helicase
MPCLHADRAIFEPHSGHGGGMSSEARVTGAGKSLPLEAAEKRRARLDRPDRDPYDGKNRMELSKVLIYHGGAPEKVPWPDLFKDAWEAAGPVQVPEPQSTPKLSPELQQQINECKPIAEAVQNAEIEKQKAEKAEDERKTWTRMTGKGTIVLEHGPIAQYLQNRFNTISFCPNDTVKTLYIYDENSGIYRYNQGDIESEIADIIRAEDARCSITRDTRDILHYLKSANRHLSYPFNNTTDSIPVNNGILKIDYTTGSTVLLPHSRLHKFSFKLPVDFSPYIPGTVSDNLINTWVEPEDTGLLYQIPAQSFLQMQIDESYKKAYLCQGEPNAGKTSYLELLERFFGQDNLSYVSLQQITRDRFAKSLMEGKLLNSYDDLSEIPLENVGTFKDLTGKTHHNIERKHQQGYNSRIFCVNVFTCNTPPGFDEKITYDAAFWERWEFIRFPYFFDVDPDFYEETLTPQLLSSFLNRVIETMITIRQGRKLQINRTAAEVMDRWSMESDPLHQFISENMVENARADDLQKFDRKKLFNVYLEYCQSQQVDPRKRITTLSKFTRDVQKYELVPKDSSTRIGSRKVDLSFYIGPYTWKNGQDEMKPENRGL